MGFGQYNNYAKDGNGRHMHTFVYGSRVIENEQQIRLERKVRKLGSWVHTLVKFLAAFFFFVVLNTLLSNLVQHTNDLFTLNTYRLIQEGMRILFVDNAFTTSSFVCQFAIGVVSAFAAYGVMEYGFTLRALGVGGEREEDEEDDHEYVREVIVTNSFNTVSYKQKVCFLS